MPLLFQSNPVNDVQVGVWRIDEDVNALLDQYPVPSDHFIHTQFRVDSRKKQWLASRIILKKLIGESFEPVTDEHGKPYCKNNSCHLSLAHSYDYACAAMSDSSEIGIDIERVHPRILKIKDKFLSEKELAVISGSEEEYIYYWAAKEAMYKKYGKRGLDFKEHLYVEEQEGESRGYITIEETQIECKLYTERIDNYILVLAY